MSPWSVVRIVVGAVMVALGALAIAASIPAAVAATAIESTVGRQGVVSQPIGTLGSAAGDVAVVADGVSARLVAPEIPDWVTGVLALAGTDVGSLSDDLGDFLLVATPTRDGGVFVGVGTPEAVNDYLDGAPYSVAVREGESWPTISVPGDKAPSPPADWPAWSLSAATAPGGQAAAEMPAGDLAGQTLVLMRPDAGPDPQADLRLEYRVPQAAAALQGSALTAAGAAMGGLLMVVLGAWLVVGRPRRTATGRHAGSGE